MLRTPHVQGETGWDKEVKNKCPISDRLKQPCHRERIETPTDSNWSLLRMVQLHICFYQWFTKLTSHVLMHFSCSNFNGGCFSECPTFTFSEFLTFCSQFPLSFSKFSLPNFQFLFHGMRIPLSPWVMAEAFGRHRVVPGIHRRIMKSLPCFFFDVASGEHMSMDWLKGKSEPETVGFTINLQGFPS